ncbi:DUF2953 domain-containing protein [Methanococcoides methylutens]|uniref:DUF2953 domain-containing protein n=1 Tax=Methanococcoides methylutens MM1 TaxID=1434104 RepID=A0A0E3STH9_METMT|nr:DUF2953 domain-containing protein [Methanococcoides methylutens]AKB86128.1 hypothetical protein MCMEM_2075 [Methanococcoides methylutens MM1]
MSLLIYTLSLYIVLLLGLVLFAPIDVVFNVRGSLDGVHSRADVKWTILSKHFSKKNSLGNEPETEEQSLDEADKGVTGDGKGNGKDKREDKGESDKGEEPGLRESFDDYYAKGRMVYGIRYPFFRLIKGLLSAIHIRDLSCDLDYGFPDPADTGMLCGYLHTLASVFQSGCRKFHYSLNPRFTDEGLDVKMSGDIRFRIASLLFPLLRFIFSMKVLRTGWWFVRNRGSSSSGVSV